MRKVALIVIVLIGILNAEGQNLPSKKEQYDFLKWYVNYKNLIPQDTSFKFNSSFSSLDIENIPLISKMRYAEKKYLFRQVKLNKANTELDLRNMALSGKSSDNHINYCFLPIFTSNKKMVIIMWGIYCGEQCGKESFDVFIKTKNNKWKRANVIVPIIVY